MRTAEVVAFILFICAMVCGLVEHPLLNRLALPLVAAGLAAWVAPLALNIH
jgi:hypothetical protein